MATEVNTALVLSTPSSLKVRACVLVREEPQAGEWSRHPGLAFPRVLSLSLSLSPFLSFALYADHVQQLACSATGAAGELRERQRPGGVPSPARCCDLYRHGPHPVCVQHHSRRHISSGPHAGGTGPGSAAVQLWGRCHQLGVLVLHLPLERPPPHGACDGGRQRSGTRSGHGHTVPRGVPVPTGSHLRAPGRRCLAQVHRCEVR